MMNERANRIVNNLIVKEKDTYRTYTLQERMEYFHTTAFSIACIDQFKIDFVYSTGNTEHEGGTRIDDQTPFMAASVSKAVFAVALMKLVQRGIIDLDRDVNTYLKGYTVPAKEGLSNKITLRMIMGHLAGLNVDGFGGYAPGQPLPNVLQVLNGEPPAKTERLMVVREPNTYVPKTTENPTGPYSGGGFVLAQKLVCDVLGVTDFAALMDELVLKSFGMTNSTFYQSCDPQFLKFYRQPLPTGYNSTRNGERLDHYEPIPGGHGNYTELAAGGLWSTAEDLAKFGVHLLGILKNDDDPELTRESFRQMLVQQKNSENGIGFYIYPTRNKDEFMFAHTGCNNGFLSMAYYLSSGKGLTMMFNSNEGLDFYYTMGRTVANEYGWPIGETQE
ncbi:MAG TPA: serine hydrolase domain-containing protein [Clostridia bacterium]|nr:serine hydrolase domain-containing protein [Clostridia bacterium]